MEGKQAFTRGKQTLTGKTMILATENAGKVKEFQLALRETGLVMAGAAESGAILPAELTAPEGGTFEGNARLKAEAVCAQTSQWVLADDSGLEVVALGGEPGVDTAHYGGWEKLLEALNSTPLAQRQARFVCVLALARPGLPTEFFHGECQGVIAAAGRGEGGFGYDPVFIAENSIFTFAEMAPEAKKKYSHRGAAIKALLAWWQQQNG